MAPLRLTIALVLTTAALLPASVARAQDTAPADLEDQMIEAYESTRTYSASVAYDRTVIQGRWTRSESATFAIAFNRDTQQLKIDLPDGMIVSDGTKLRMRYTDVPGGYLEIDAPNPLTYQSLLEVGLHIISPMLVDVMLLLGDSPRAALQVDRAKVLAPAAQDANKRPGLLYADNQGALELRLDPLNLMIARCILTPNVQSMGAGPDDSATVMFDITLERRNRELHDDAFAFDVNDGQAFGSVQELMVHAQAVQMGGAPAAMVNHPLVGQLAPALDLPDVADKHVKVKEDQSQIVIIAFWNTWDDDSITALKALQTLSETINAELPAADGEEPTGKVAIYTVNSGDTAKEIIAAFEKHKITLPALLDDEQASAAFAYQVQGVPTIFITDDTRVTKVFLQPATVEELTTVVSAIRSPDENTADDQAKTTATIDEITRP